MPDLSNLLDSPSVPDPATDNSAVRVEPQSQDNDLQQLNLVKARVCSATGGSEVAVPEKSKKVAALNGRAAKEANGEGSRSLEDLVRVWMEKKMASGFGEKECALPFLVNAPKVVECRICNKAVYSGDEISCSITSCQLVFHINCVMPSSQLSNFKSFKCPQHACFKCKRMGHWRCLRCTVAAHKGCEPWPSEVIYFPRHQGRAVCWKHSANWLLEKEHAVPTRDIEEVFHRLPLPYIDKEFYSDFMKDYIRDESMPFPYVHIRRNIYLVKRKRDSADADIGCRNCRDKRCSEDCVCRVQSISCSKACNCSDTCTNKPFRKEKKVRIVKTKFCGWGVEAAVTIKEGEFVIEYIGEVIDDTLCEQRLWDMKYRGAQNFYMCEIGKDFTIDATFKGNASRFLNHSCDPNCKLEKWQVDGETRVGVFASQLINVGEPLTYDYRFVQFGPMVACRCGAANCQGYLGIKKKIDKIVVLSWGAKRKRSTMIHDPVST